MVSSWDHSFLPVSEHVPKYEYVNMSRWVACVCICIDYQVFAISLNRKKKHLVRRSIGNVAHLLSVSDMILFAEANKANTSQRAHTRLSINESKLNRLQ